MACRPGQPGRAGSSAVPGDRRVVPGLDGLERSLVLAVMAFHAGLPWARGGDFLGVDVFFVLSGYLITSLLVREHARTGRIALRQFWARRARRLLPGLLILSSPGSVLYARLVADPAPEQPVAGTPCRRCSTWRTGTTSSAAKTTSFASGRRPRCSPPGRSPSEEQFYLVSAAGRRLGTEALGAPGGWAGSPGSWRPARRRSAPPCT